MPIVEPQVVVDGLGRQHGGKVIRQGLHAAERAVAADADQPLDLQALHPFGDFADRGVILGVDVIARGADDRAAHRGVELRDGGEQRVQPHVGHPRIEQAAEPLDEADHLDFALVGAHDRAVHRRVQSRRVAAGGQQTNTLHNEFTRGDSFGRTEPNQAKRCNLRAVARQEAGDGTDERAPSRHIRRVFRGF